MPITRTFVYDEDFETGMTGLRPTWFENATPSEGLTVAHDMLEHFKMQCGALEGECEAMGACLALRLEQGWAAIYRPYNSSPATQLGMSVSEMLRDAAWKDLRLPVAKRTVPLRDNEWAEEVIQAGVDDGINRALQDFARDDEYWAEQLREPTLRAAFVSWIRAGYRKALRRYKACDLYTIGIDFFKRVQDTVDQLLRSEMLGLGSRVSISLSPRTFGINVRVEGYDAYDFGYL